MELPINNEDMELVKQFYHELHTGYKDPTKIIEVYKGLVPIYDQVSKIIILCCNDELDKVLTSSFNHLELDKKLILDVGAGTGILGEKLM